MTRSGLIRIALLLLVLGMGYQLLRERQAIRMRQELVGAGQEQVVRAVQELLRSAEDVLLRLQVMRGSASTPGATPTLGELEATVHWARAQLPAAELIPTSVDEDASFLQIVEAPFPPVPVLQQIADSLTTASLQATEVLVAPDQREVLLDQRAQVLLMAARHHALELELQNHLRKPLAGAVAVLLQMGKDSEVADE